MGKEGYISLHRTLLDNPIFNSEPYTKGQAWVAILMLTNHKEGYITVKNGKMIKIERGECGFSELALSDIFKWSRGKVKRFLILLESEKMIQQKIVENHSIIKVLNYDKFQNSTTNDTTNDTINDTTNGIVFAASAGIMVYLCFDELLPLAYEYCGEKKSVISIICGFAVMAVSLTLLSV